MYNKVPYNTLLEQNTLFNVGRLSSKQEVMGSNPIGVLPF